LITLLAALGALMLVPIAQASAAEVFVEIEGSGAGEVSSTEPVFGSFELPGEPPIECSYASPGPEEGSCEAEESSFYEEEENKGLDGIGLTAYPAEGSELTEWKVTFVGEGPKGPGSSAYGCPVPSLEACLPVYEAEGPGETEGNVIEVVATFEAEAGPEEFPLTTVIKGGPGTVVSDPAGIECTGPVNTECEAGFEEGSEVTLTASPSAGYRFYTWVGCGSINGRQCTVEMNEAKEVRAVFFDTSALTVSKAEGSEPGIIKSAPGGAICYFSCQTATLSYDAGTEVTVFYNAPKYRHFKEFTGGTGQAEACNGETECTFTADGSDSSIEAVFERDEQATLSIDKEGGGQARITIQPNNVVCVNTCSATTADFYTEPSPEEATVEWELGAGTSSIEWASGAGTCTGESTEATGECTVTMDEAHELVAKLE
jgi:hypothetical protein